MPGCATSSPGASAASSGGGTAFRPGTARMAPCSWAATEADVQAQADCAIRPGRDAGAGRRTCWTRGFPRRFGRSPPSAGRSRKRGRGALLPGRRAGDRVRHHLLLGGPDDDDGPAFHGRRAVPHRVHPRPGAGRARRQDEQVQRQRDRSAGDGGPVWRRRAALHHMRADRAGPGCEARPGAGRGIPPLRDQAVECGQAVRAERGAVADPAFDPAGGAGSRSPAGSWTRPTRPCPGGGRARWRRSASTSMRPHATASPGTCSATGSWSSPSRASPATPSCARHVPTCSVCSCACCTRRCRS